MILIYYILYNYNYKLFYIMIQNKSNIWKFKKIHFQIKLHIVEFLYSFQKRKFFSPRMHWKNTCTSFVRSGIWHLSTSHPIYLLKKQFPTDSFAFSTLANRIGKCTIMLRDVINFCKQRPLVHGLLFSTTQRG